MPPKMHGRLLLPSLLALTASALLVAGCSSGSSTSSANAAKGPSFLIGTDAPLGSVTSFLVQVQSISATDSNNTTVQLLSSPATVDFARYNGLQTLLDLGNVPAGTYNSVSVTLGAATIGYLDTTVPGPPVIKTMPATITTPTTTATLSDPLVVTTGGAPMGLRVELNLYKSVQVDTTGQITGVVSPVFRIERVGDDDTGAHIDEFTAAVVSVNAGAQSFVVQGPHGTTIPVNVTAQTEWANNATLNDLTSSSIVQISGKLDSTTLAIDASEIAIVSQNGFYASGLVTYVNPASGPATSFDLYVRGLLPTNTGLTLGQIATVDLSGSENFSIYWRHDMLSQYVFNQSTLLPGQSISVGGPASGAANASAVSVNRVVLHHWGFNGVVVPGSVNTSMGTFQMQITGFAGVLVPQTVTVYITNGTDFRDGWSGLSDLSDNAHVRVVGLLLKDPTSGATILVGHDVDDLENE